MAIMKDDLMDELESLVQMDFDASKCYQQAIDEIDDPEIRMNMERFRDDHERHISNLSAIIRQYDGVPPERSRDLKAFFLEGFTAIRSQTGTVGALNAMETNEKMTNKRYSNAVTMDFPADVMMQLQRNYQDEKMHLQYIQENLKVRA